MLSAGLLGSYLGDALGPGNVVAITFRFREIVWPGESLTCRAEVVAERDDGDRRVVDLDISCALADGRIAVEGSATFVRDEQARMSGPLVVTTTIPLRWADTDGLGHIWHGTHVALIEEARTAWLNRLCRRGESLWDHAVLHVELDFRAELGYGDGHAVVTCEGTGFGTKSVRTHEVVCNPAGAVVAEARSVVVAWEPARPRDAGAARRRARAAHRLVQRRRAGHVTPWPAGPGQPFDADTPRCR